MNFQPIIFDKSKSLFVKTLKKRVDEYFKSNKISKYANFSMYLKSFSLIIFYFGSYTTLYLYNQSYYSIFLWFMMGVGMAGIGMSVMHDANHGAYSKNKNINKFFGFFITFLGGSYINWKIQHNVLHHTYTNISSMDEDIDSGSLFRFSPDQKLRKHHRFQHLYAWFLYGLMTIQWSIEKDFIQLVRYHKKGLLKIQKKNFSKEMMLLIFYKTIYYGYALILPLIFFKTWWLVLIGYFIMHYTAGIILSVVFQCAHVMEPNEFKSPNKERTIKRNWFEHQLNTTCNFAMNSKILSWFIGGLNFQIEHHLFPNICHIHYKKLSKIVQTTAKDFNIPYKSYKNMFSAVHNHYKFLKHLGSLKIA